MIPEVAEGGSTPLPISPPRDGARTDQPKAVPIQHTLDTTDTLSLRQITCLIGAFGSGKTEIAINLALSAARQSKRVSLIDLDTVTPAFRSREVASALRRGGVRLLGPEGQLAYADLPSVTPAVRGALDDPTETVIVDVGGNPAGARSLGSLSDLIERRPYDCWAVVCPWRPDTRDPSAIVAMIKELSRVSRLPVTGLVCNLHVPFGHSSEDLQWGAEVVRSAAGEINTPVVMYAVARPALPAARAAVGEDALWLGLDLYMRPPWEQLDSPGSDSPQRQ